MKIRVTFFAILISFCSIDAWSEDSKCAKYFLGTNAIEPAELAMSTQNWSTESYSILTQKLKKLDEYRPTQLEWLNQIPRRSSAEPISSAASSKIQMIIQQQVYLNEIRTNHLFRLTQHNLFKTLDYNNVLPNTALAPALAHIYLRTFSQAAIRIYLEDLMTHAFQVMQRSNDLSLQEKALNGILDHETIVGVLKYRLKSRNIPITEIKWTDELPNYFFRRAVKKGVPIDIGFQFAKKPSYSTEEHGVYTHLIQFDMISDLIVYYSKLLGKSPQIFFDFFSTKFGNAYWYAAFDGSGTTESHTGFTNPFFVGRLALFMKLRTPLEEVYYNQRPEIYKHLDY